MTTTDDRDRDGNISNGTTHIMSSHHSAFRFFFTRKRKLVTAMLWPLRWLFSVTFLLLFGHEDPFKKITKKKNTKFPIKDHLGFRWKIHENQGFTSSAQLPAVLFMTASYKEKNKTKWKPIVTTILWIDGWSNSFSFLCLLFDQTQQNGSVIGMHDQVVGLLSLRCIFLLFAGKALRQLASLSFSLYLCLFIFLLINYAAHSLLSFLLAMYFWFLFLF